MSSILKRGFFAFVFFSGLISIPAVADTCPTGGVIDSDRAYFGTVNQANVCDDEGQQCNNIYFFEQSGFSTAVCSDGTWVNEAVQTVTTPTSTTTTSASDTCPDGGVFPDGRAYYNGVLKDNVCATEGATCANAYFYDNGGHQMRRCLFL